MVRARAHAGPSTAPDTGPSTAPDAGPSADPSAGSNAGLKAGISAGHRAGAGSGLGDNEVTKQVLQSARFLRTQATEKDGKDFITFVNSDVERAEVELLPPFEQLEIKRALLNKMWPEFGRTVKQKKDREQFLKWCWGYLLFISISELKKLAEDIPGTVKKLEASCYVLPLCKLFLLFPLFFPSSSFLLLLSSLLFLLLYLLRYISLVLFFLSFFVSCVSFLLFYCFGFTFSVIFYLFRISSNSLLLVCYGKQVPDSIIESLLDGLGITEPEESEDTIKSEEKRKRKGSTSAGTSSEQPLKRLFSSSSKGKQKASSSSALEEEAEKIKQDRNKALVSIVLERDGHRCVVTRQIICLEIAHFVSFTATKSKSIITYVDGNWGIIERMFPNNPIFLRRIHGKTNKLGGIDIPGNLAALCNNIHDLLDRGVIAFKPLGNSTDQSEYIRVAIICLNNPKIDRINKKQFDSEDMRALSEDLGVSYNNYGDELDMVDLHTRRRIQTAAVFYIHCGEEHYEEMHDMLSLRFALGQIRSLAGAVDLDPFRKQDDDEDNTGVEGVKAKETSTADS